jgi:Tfp pilus assembly protein PilF
MADETSIKQLVCPSGTCQIQNPYTAETCQRCGLPLRGFARVSSFPNLLFNMGLAKARENQLQAARDLFAAVVYWCPKDSEARNAYAMSCFALGDHETARSNWEKVLKQSPTDAIAKRGLVAIDEAVENSKKPHILAAKPPQSRAKLGRSKFKVKRIRRKRKHNKH